MKEKEEIYSYEAYVFEFLFSLSVICLISNVILVTQIKFGDKLVTNLSLRPYIISFLLFCVMTLEFASLCLAKNVIYKVDQSQFWQDLFNPL